MLDHLVLQVHRYTVWGNRSFNSQTKLPRHHHHPLELQILFATVLLNGFKMVNKWFLGESGILYFCHILQRLAGYLVGYRWLFLVVVSLSSPFVPTWLKCFTCIWRVHLVQKDGNQNRFNRRLWCRQHVVLTLLQLFIHFTVSAPNFIRSYQMTHWWTLSVTLPDTFHNYSTWAGLEWRRCFAPVSTRQCNRQQTRMLYTNVWTN